MGAFLTLLQGKITSNNGGNVGDHQAVMQPMIGLTENTSTNHPSASYIRPAGREDGLFKLNLETSTSNSSSSDNPAVALSNNANANYNADIINSKESVEEQRILQLLPTTTTTTTTTTTSNNNNNNSNDNNKSADNATAKLLSLSLKLPELMDNDNSNAVNLAHNHISDKNSRANYNCLDLKISL